MKRYRRLKTVIVVATVLLAITVCGIWLQRTESPVHDGVRLDDLLDSLMPAGFGEAPKAVEALGPKALSYLLDVLANEPTPFQRHYGRLYTNFPSAVRKRLPPPKRIEIRKLRAAALIRHAGTNAWSAVPTLLELAKNDGHWGVRHNALHSLGFLAPNTEFAPAAIELAIAAARDSDPNVRQHGYGVLGHFTNHANVVVPELLYGLRDQKTRESCLYALKRFGRNVMSVVRERVKVEGFLPMSFEELEKELAEPL